MHNNSVKFSAVGDISVGDHYFSMGHGVGTAIKRLGIQSMLKNIEKYFSESDIVLANLEGVLSDSSCKDSDKIEGYVFRGGEEVAFDLKAVGINVVNVANNHILQHGIIAWENTINSLLLADIAIVGRKGTGVFSSQPVYIDVRGIKVAILGYSAVQEAYFPECEVYAAAEPSMVLNDVQQCRLQADIVIVSIHAGAEGCTLPEYGLTLRCKEMADAGANIVLAHHAHVFHPIENYHGSCIAYGLGDLLFDLLWDDSLLESGIVLIDIDAGGCIESIDIVPVKIQQDMTIRKMDGEEKMAFLDRLAKIQNLLVDGEKYQNYFQHKLKLDVNRLESKKLPYLIKNIYKGDTKKKLQFLVRKTINKISIGT